MDFMRFTVSDLLSGRAFGSGGTLTTSDILVTLAITFLLSMFIFVIYRKTYAGVVYSREFNVTLVIVALIVSVIMLGISRNLALSLGMIGALSIVRFRTAVKDPKDISFLFWSISVGIVNGVQLYKLSIISSIVIGVLLLILSKKVLISQPYMLILKYEGRKELIFEPILKRFCKRFRVRSTVMADSHEFVIEIKIKKNKEHPLLRELRALEGVTKVSLFSFTGELGD